MRHRGVQVGNFFLSKKEKGREFTSEDEEVLVLFASQAATAIANARTYRDEQRARADLEALVDTSPVGVVVFDTRTGNPVSLNREAKRIVEGLGMPGRSPEQLLDVIKYRRADGREVALDEFPLAGQLSSGEKVRAEEIVLSVPDGRSVTTLVNATPIHSADGEVESVVVTLQGPGAAAGAGEVAGRVPGHGEPRAAGPADLHQGLGRHPAGRLAGFGPGRDAPVLPDHQRAGRSHARPDQRPAGCGAHRGGHAVGHPRAGGGGRPGGPGQEHVPERRRQARRPHRSSAGPTASDGRQPADRAGPEQPFLERIPALSRVVAHPGGRGAGWRARCDLGIRRRQWRAAGPAAAPVPEACRCRRLRSGARSRWVRPGPGHLQGAGGGPRGPHLGRERRGGPGHTVHLHDSGDRRGRQRRRDRLRSEPLPARVGKGSSRRASW